jgi:validoxylamine A glucosyltransferase
MIAISVIIGTYNQGHLLRKVLGGYTQQTLPSDQFEIIVADSSSTDDTAAIVADFSMLPIQYHCIDNQGKAYARNYAVKQAVGQYLLITDADMIPAEQCIEAHVRAHEATQTPTCFEGAAFNLKTLDWPLKFSGMTPQIGKVLRKKKPLGWYYFLTGNVSIPTHLFNHVNGFSIDFTGYGWEDLELGYRLHQLKIPLMYLPESINYHYHIIHTVSELSRYEEKGRSACIFLSKHPELKWFLGFHPITMAIAKRISLTSCWYRWATQYAHSGRFQWQKRLGSWFLTEYHYRIGALGDGQTVL